MAAFMKTDSPVIKGQITDEGHKEWIEIKAMSSPIFRSIAQGAKDTQRTQGDTTLGDIVIVRNLDTSSVELQKACANGTPIKKVTIHFTLQAKNKQETYLEYILENVIITSYSIHVNEKGDPTASEELTLAYTKVEWNYTKINPETFNKETPVRASFEVGKNVAK